MLRACLRHHPTGTRDLEIGQKGAEPLSLPQHTAALTHTYPATYTVLLQIYQNQWRHV